MGEDTEHLIGRSTLLFKNISTLKGVPGHMMECSEVLDDIQYDELNKLKAELKIAKFELNQMADQHHDQIDDFHIMLKKIKAEQNVVETIKSQKQRESMNDLKVGYENKLKAINDKLSQTQSGHLSELKKLKNENVKHKLEAKLSEKKIKELRDENKELLREIEQSKTAQQKELEKLKKKYDEEMEQEVNKRIAQISELKREKNELLQELNSKKNEKQGVKTDENENMELEKLKKKIKDLEARNEKEQEMFFRHNEIFEYKLEREIKEKKMLSEKLEELENINNGKIKVLKEKVEGLKQQLSQKSEVVIHLQQNLDMIFDENKRLKDVENDKMMDTDYEKMDEMLHDLQTKNKQKEQELNDYKKFVSQKESENKSLRVSVNSHNQTINKLE